MNGLKILIIGGGIGGLTSAIALGKGKKNYDKRATLKKRDDDRNAHRDLKGNW